VHHFGGSTPVTNPGPGDVWAERAPVERPDWDRWNRDQPAAHQL